MDSEPEYEAGWNREFPVFSPSNKTGPNRLIELEKGSSEVECTVDLVGRRFVFEPFSDAISKILRSNDHGVLSVVFGSTLFSDRGMCSA